MKTRIVTLSIVGLWIGLSYAVLQGRPAAAPAQEPAKKSVWDGVYTKEQAQRGEALYLQNCAPCHGPTLAGAELAPPLTGAEFSANWDKLTVGDLFERIRISMPADDPSKLSATQKADIVAQILSVGKFPAGEMELAKEPQVLSQIQYLATKP